MNIPKEHKNYINTIESHILVSNSSSESEKPNIIKESRPYFIAVPENYSFLNTKEEAKIVRKQEILEDQTKWQDLENPEESFKRGWIFMDFEMAEKRYKVKKIWVKEKSQPPRTDEIFLKQYNAIAKRIFERMRKIPTRPL